MSPDHESSYYEIALTNRQVLTIFVVLLTCLVAAFLSGVWIGRGDEPQAPREAAVGDPEVDPAAQLTELNFFSDGAPRDGRTEAGGKAPASDPSAPPAKPPEKPAPTPPMAKDAEPAPSEPAPRPATPPAETKAPATAPAASSTGGAGRVIQVFSTLDAEQADKLVRRLGNGGYPAFLVEESLQGRTTYRVRVGPYEQDAKAQKIAEQLRRDYRLETWITSQPG